MLLGGYANRRKVGFLALPIALVDLPAIDDVP
jgi:hypothetical protein